MDLKRTTIILCICVFSGLKPTQAQFEDLEACLTGDFVPLFADCMVQSIVGGIDTGLTLSQFSSYDIGTSNGAGRKLQSLQTDYQLSSNARRNYVNMKMESAGIKQNKIFDDLKKLGRLWSLGMREEAISEKLKSFNLKETIGEHYMLLLKEHLGEIVEVIADLRLYEAKINDGNKVFNQPETDKTLREMLSCLNKFTDADFEDNLDWLQCLMSCDDLGPLWTCTTEAMAVAEAPCSNVVWFADSVVALVANFLNKSSCDFALEEPTMPTSSIQLTEGGDAEHVYFKSYLPPGVLCIGPDPINDPIQLGLAVVGNVFGFNVTCDVEMQLTTSNWLDDTLPYIPTPSNRFRPKCRIPNRSLRQVAIGFHDAAVNNSGIFKITNENWNTSFEVPLLPVVDHRVDGNVSVSFTMKMYVQQVMRGQTVKLNVDVIDTDVNKPGIIDGSNGVVECYSVNDPHIMTFDGHYYNNFYQGAFYLYKHDEFPYEVQTINQPCERGNNNGTCACAVAVRSGDDVFVMDRCRRCVDEVCDVSSSQLTVLYTRGEVTPGTQIFRMSGGLRHDVVLPHGTIVKIIASNDLLNVWIMPGSYDRNHTMGLCGTFNEDDQDDLTMPDGSLYSGPGDAVLEQPRDFNEGWRVPEEELIFYGSKELNQIFRPVETCTCTHVLMSGADCDCGRGTATELCDLFLENPYSSENISSIIIPSVNNGSAPNYLADIDLDETYIPPDLNGWTGNWNETAAKQFCTNLIENSDNPIIKKCLELDVLQPVTTGPALMFCMQDIQILGNTNWKNAALDNVMYRCYNEMVRSLSTQVEDLELFPNSSCINQCNDNGLCDNGVCICNNGFYGQDCQLVTDEDPNLSNKDTQLCDRRHQMCNYATIFGYNFPDDGSMLCQMKNVEISPEGVDYLPVRYYQTWEREMIVINSNQAVCPLPMNGSFEVYTVWDAQQSDAASMWSSILPQNLLGESHTRMKRHTSVTKMEAAAQESDVEVKFIFISYDSACYTCHAATQSCEKKMTDDHCWINSTCWAPGETKPNDPCRLCSPKQNMNDWTMSNATQACIDQAIEEEQEAEDKKQEMILRGAVGGSISLLVVIVVIIMFCVSRKKEKKSEEAAKERLNNITVEPKLGTVFYEDGHKGFENHAMAKDDEGYDVIRHNSFGGSSIGRPQVLSKTRVDALKSEEVVRSADNADITTFKTAL